VPGYFVSNSGSNSNAGTQASPWQTIAYALSSSLAGDTINLAGGNTFSENPSLTSGRTIQSYGSGQATISYSNASVITITNCSGIVLSNLIINCPGTTTGSNNNQANVFLEVTSGVRYTGGIKITNCLITGGYIGVFFSPQVTDAGGWNGVTITGNTINGQSKLGIGCYQRGYSGGYGGNPATYTSLSNVLISGNTIHDISGATIEGADGTGILLGHCDSVAGPSTISYNYVHDCGKFTGTSCAGMFPQNSNGVTIEYNVVHNIWASSAGVDGEGIDVDLYNANTLVQYNYTFNNQGPGYSSFTGDSGNVIRWNLSVNDNNLNTQGSGSIWLAGLSGSTFQIYNNTVIATGPNPAVMIQSGELSSNSFYNNILVSKTGVATVAAAGSLTSSDFEGNAYLSGTSSFLNTIGSTNYTSLSAWHIGTGYEASGHGFSGAISFVGPPGPLTTIVPSTLWQCTNYQLAVGSQLVGAGLNLLASYGINPGYQDLLGNPLSVPYSVGSIAQAFGFVERKRLLEATTFKRLLENLTSYRVLEQNKLSTGTMMMMIVNLGCP
jgi:hypothetical protein